MSCDDRSNQSDFYGRKVAFASKVPIYGHSAAVVEFLLLAGSTDADVDPENAALIERGNKGLAPLLNVDSWTPKAGFTVEHTASQSSTAESQAKDLYTDTPTVNRFGNLALLPSVANSHVGTRPWQQKRLVYRNFWSETPGKAEATYKTFSEFGLSISKRSDAIHGNACFMPMRKVLGRLAND